MTANFKLIAAAIILSLAGLPVFAAEPDEVQALSLIHI